MFERVAASAAGSIGMTATFKICSRKNIYIKISFAAKRAFDFFITVNNKRSQFNTLDGQWIIYKSFRIAGFYLVFNKIFPGTLISAVLYS